METITGISHYIGQDEERAALWWLFEISCPDWNFEQMSNWGF